MWADMGCEPMMTTTGQDRGSEEFAEEVFAGRGAAVTRLRLQVERIAPHFRMALLVGEAGTGSRTVARELHRRSLGAGAHFVEMRVGEFTESGALGRGEATFFVSGIETAAHEAQEGLLGTLQRCARDTRVVMASECDLRGLVATGKMRTDLYGWVRTPEIRVPSLRERKEDMTELALGMIRRLGGVAALGESALGKMLGYGWPGNLRELWEVCSQMRGAVEAADLVWLAAETREDKVVRLDAVVERHVVEVLQQCAGNKLKAAELLGISRSTLYRMLETAAG